MFLVGLVWLDQLRETKGHGTLKLLFLEILWSWNIFRGILYFNFRRSAAIFLQFWSFMPVRTLEPIPNRQASQSGLRFTAFWVEGWEPGSQSGHDFTTWNHWNSRFPYGPHFRCAESTCSYWSTQHRWIVIGRVDDTDGPGACEATIPVLRALILSRPLDTEF